MRCLALVVRLGALALAATLGFEAWATTRGAGVLPLGPACVAFALLAAVSLVGHLGGEVYAARPGTSGILAGAVLATLLTAGLYAPVVDSWWQGDDLFFVATMRGAPASVLGEWWIPRAHSNWQFYRPLSNTLNWALLQSYGSGARLPHAITIALHGLSAVCLCWLAARASGRATTGALAGALFAVHPLAVSTVAWVDNYQDQLVVLFTTAALALLLASLDGKRWLTAASLACVVLGLTSKEPAVAAPIPGVVLAMLYSGGERRWRRAAGAAAPMILLVAAYVAMRFVVFGGPGGYSVEGRSVFLIPNPEPLQAVLLQLPEVLLVGANQAVVAGAASLLAIAAALGVLTLGLLTGAGPGVSRHVRLAAVGAAWVAGACVPVHNMLWMGPHLLNARYLYLATAGFALMAAALIGAVAASDGRRAVVAALLATAVLGGSAAVAVANRDHWLAVNSLPRGLADNLRALDARGPVGRVRFHGFPHVREGSYVFHLELLPAVALGRALPTEAAQPDGSVSVTGAEAPADGLTVDYHHLPDDRLWRRAPVAARTRPARAHEP